MIKYNQFNKLKLIILLNLSLKYSAWVLFFIFQGRAIHLAIEGNSLPLQLTYSLIIFVGIKMMVMMADIFEKFIISYFKNLEIQNQWQHSFPRNLYFDNRNSHNHLKAYFFDYFPKIYDLEVSLITNTVTLYIIFIWVISFFIYSGFYIEIIALVLIFLLNIFSKNILTEKINEQQVEINHQTIKIMNWVDQYFLSFKEISKNWLGLIHSNWRMNLYDQYHLYQSKQIQNFFYRDLLNQLSIDFPFLINTALVIIAVYNQYITVTELFVWIGFSQFMITASNAYFENQMNSKQLAIYNTKAIEVLREFESKISSYAEDKARGENVTTEVILLDGMSNTVSTAPGLYHIKGNNGSGKSTFLNLILNYERQDLIFKNANLPELRLSIKQDHIRVIERDAVLFDCLANFSSQVCGPFCNTNLNWQAKVNQSLALLLEPHLANQCTEIFISLESKYINRKNNQMSSGERVILSLMRFFASWNNQVSLLIVDECDSFLDQATKTIFLKALKCLASHMAIYITSHSMADISLYNK